MEVVLRSALGDIVAVKSKLRTLAALASRFPGWRAVEFLGRSRYYELQRDRETALELALAGLELARPGRHPFFGSLAATHITLLADLGRLAESVAAAKQYLAINEQLKLNQNELILRATLVLARANECERALQALEPVMRQVEELGRVGLSAGLVYEARARIALAMNDVQTFTHFTDRCAVELGKSQNPAVLTRLALLLDEARAHGLLPTPLAEQISKSLKPAAHESEYDTLHSRFVECDGPPDRARCALTMLLQYTSSNLGYLYLTRADRTTVLAASLPDDPADPGVKSWVQRYASAWFETEVSSRESGEVKTESIEAITASVAEESTSTNTDSLTLTGAGADAGVPRVFVDSEGRSLQAVTLIGEPYAVDRKLCGLLIVESAGTSLVRVPEALTSAVAVELLQHGDAVAWKVEPAPKSASEP
jgi:tetratricopeptide (TPR) repeat protein